MRVIEDCRGDFGNIAAMMEAAWAASATPPFLYTADYLASCFAYPGAALSLAPTIYDDDTPVAFVAGFPRRIRLMDRERTIVLVSLLTAAAEHRNKGYGIVIWTELVRRAREAGFEGMVNYCVEGEAMNKMIVGACARLRLPVERIFSIGYLTRLLRSATSADAETSVVPVDAFLAAAAPVAATASLARLWTRAEAEWQCTRTGAAVVTQRADDGEGVLSGYVMPIANPQRTKCLIVDDVLWGGLAEDDQQALVGRIVSLGAAARAQIAVVPQQGYADTEAFTSAGFRPSARIVHTYLTIWSDGVPPKRVPSCYLDVF